ncbi:hypothetical protein [Microbacterium oleivorans]|uniref:hypothetical protein n=1 Tax=Microbacterium oleivorans TaxID=273677 RepID=UPI000767B359|nr:hypothetical protein [Microbacterium oleivorans]
MVFLGWIVLAVGAGLLGRSLWATLRDNPGRTVPYNRRPGVVPRGSILWRSLGVAMFVLSAVLLSAEYGPWIVVLPLGVVLVGFGAIVLHNRRVGQAAAE